MDFHISANTGLKLLEALLHGLSGVYPQPSPSPDGMDWTYPSTAMGLLPKPFSCSGLLEINSICFFWPLMNMNKQFSVFSCCGNTWSSHTLTHTHTQCTSLTTPHRSTKGMASYSLHHLSGMRMQSEELETITVYMYTHTCTHACIHGKSCQAIF